jgi:hypothetical protein
MKKRMILILFAACLALNCFSVARANGYATDQNLRPELPHNLILSREARRLLEKVWRRSPTFRFQCASVSQAHWLKIKLSLVAKQSRPKKYRALTVVNKQTGIAKVEIFLPDDWVELIGHEFEHVLEQIEEVNLAALVAEKSGQARRHDDGAFETARALNAGRRVKAEYRRAKSADDAAEEQSLLTTIRE